jgi:hypothetical protein
MLHFEKIKMKVESTSLPPNYQPRPNLKGARLPQTLVPGHPEHIKGLGLIEFQGGFPRREATRVTMKPKTYEKRKDTCSTPREVEALGWHGLLVTTAPYYVHPHASSATDPPAAVHTVVSNPYHLCQCQQTLGGKTTRNRSKGAGCRSFWQG